MLIRTSKGNEYEGVLCYAPTYDNALMIQIHDTRKLSVIAAEFEGATWVEVDDIQSTRYNGYFLLKLISYFSEGIVQLKLYKG